MLLIYYKSYITHIIFRASHGDDSRVCRLFRVLEPLVASIDKTRKLSKEEEEYILDATEQTIERPQKHQSVYSSGRKKRHTINTEIRVIRQERIVNVSKSYPRSEHDFSLYKKERPVEQESWVYADSRYQGLDKRRADVDIPYKSSKRHPLDGGSKAYNQALSKIRIKVEYILAQIKSFRIMQERYRNKRRAYHLKLNIISGLVNIKNGFSSVTA